MIAGRSRCAVAAGLLMLAWATVSVAAPCCIVIVPPPPPPPPQPTTSLPASHVQIFGELPLFAALEMKAFGALKVEIRRQPPGTPVENAVSAMQGTLGMDAVNVLARYKAKTEANVEIAAVLINRPTYGLYTTLAGPSKIQDLKGKRIAIPAVGTLAHVAAIETLRSVGLSEKDVQFVTLQSSEFSAGLAAGLVDAAPSFIAAPEFRNVKPIAVPDTIRLPSWVLYARIDTLEKEVKEVAQFINGLTQGVKIVKGDSGLVRAILERQFGITNPETQELIVKHIPRVIPDSIKPVPEEITRTLDILRAVGQFEKAPSLTRAERLKQLYPH